MKKGKGETLREYVEQGQRMSKVRAAQRRAEKAAAEAPPVEAPLPSWLTGSKKDLPMRPPGKDGAA